MAHSNLTVTTTYLDIAIGGNTPGAPQKVPNADGTVGDNTAWLSGTAAAGTYPGALTGFQAVNSSSNKPVSGLRLVSVLLTGDTGTSHTFDVNAYDSGLSKVYALLSLVNDTDTDESLLAAATVVAHESGTIAYTTGGNTDVVLLTAIVG
tara:strand:+ start:599 stop:1048 length:450 start_codon:yes stop_codon:yes gene_type:complete